mmetsp:Transcript_39791/g.71425  ORF Transcript_39791/g.71425 Transcript_39791/m.71425 type:complete len:223 (-) Transcript_39791:96-764(-)
MSGELVTSGLFLNRASFSASGTTRTCATCATSVQAQKDWSRGVCRTGSPTTDLNHCRSVSTMDTRAMGTLKMPLISFVMSSKRSSRFESRRLYLQRQSTRKSSEGGCGAGLCVIPCGISSLLAEGAGAHACWATFGAGATEGLALAALCPLPILNRSTSSPVQSQIYGSTLLTTGITACNASRLRGTKPQPLARHPPAARKTLSRGGFASARLFERLQNWGQ